MYAVIRTGGKQYKVAPGETLNIEKIIGGQGDMLDLNEVLLVDDGKSVKVGRPLVAGAVVKCEIVEQGRGPKLIIFKKTRRQGHQKKKGHRQSLTKVVVKEIVC